MRFDRILAGLLKGKFFIATFIGLALLGSATVAAFASTSSQHVVSTSPTKTAATPANHDQNDDKNNCPGQPEALHLSSSFNLNSTTSLRTICTLHQGTFKGTSSKGTSVMFGTKLGFGQIGQVLTQAQQLAVKAGTKLNDNNLQQFVADTLQNCGATMQCVHTNNGDDKNGNHDANDDNNKNQHGNNGNHNGNDDKQHGNNGGNHDANDDNNKNHGKGN